MKTEKKPGLGPLPTSLFGKSLIPVGEMGHTPKQGYLYMSKIPITSKINHRLSEDMSKICCPPPFVLWRALESFGEVMRKVSRGANQPRRASNGMEEKENN